MQDPINISPENPYQLSASGLQLFIQRTPPAFLTATNIPNPFCSSTNNVRGYGTDAAVPNRLGDDDIIQADRITANVDQEILQVVLGQPL